jgi:histone H3/H4
MRRSLETRRARHTTLGWVTLRTRRLVRYMIDELTATLTATRSTISPSTKIMTHDSTPDSDLCGPSRTLWMDLRLRALLLGGDDTERDLARATLTDPILVAMARRRPSPQTSREQAIRHSEIRRLARAVRAGRRALTANRTQLQTIVEEMAPGLTERRGIGAVTAAQVIVSFSHPERCRSDAAFAALSGTSPLPASSGQTVRHRLNRGGDRGLNRAIHIITLTRMRCCPTTKQYIARRIAEGKSSREIQRCLKRYIARELFRTLNANAATLASPTTALAAA